MARPAYGITHALHFDLCAKFQPFELRALRQHELRLSNFPGERIPRIEAAALQNFTVFALDRDPQNSRHTRDSIVRETDDETQIARLLIAPDKRRPHAVADTAADAIERGGIRLIIGLQVFRVDLVKIPKREVIRADVDDVRDHIFGRRNPFDCRGRVRRLPGDSLLEQRGDPRWTIAERFDLFVFNEYRVAANPVV